MTPRPIVAVVVTSHLGVLVARRTDGKPPWTFIAGEIEPGEDPANAAVPEVREETGLRIRTAGLIGRRVHPDTEREMVYLAARPTHGTKIVVGDVEDLAEVRWVDLDQADELMGAAIFEPVRSFLEEALKAQEPEMTNGDGRRYPDGLPRHSVSAGGAVIRRDGRMLAIKRADNGEWVLPGGIVELDEDPRDTVRREVLEETGVTVEPGRLTGVYKNMRLGVVSLVFRCRPVLGAARPTAEATEVAWLDSAQVTGHMAEAFAIRLLDALEMDEPRIRIHDGQHLLG